jgi:hypothetical protein
MSDSAALPRLAAKTPARILASWRGALFLAAAAGALSGLLFTTPDQAASAQAAAGPELAMLLRFMAVVKAGMALATLALTAWRFGFSISPAQALGYLGAGTLMAAAPLPIWQLAHVAAGAALFHLGLLLLLVALFADRGTAAELARSATQRWRHA